MSNLGAFSQCLISVDGVIDGPFDVIDSALRRAPDDDRRHVTLLALKTEYMAITTFFWIKTHF